MGCCSNNDEERPVLNVLQDKFRRGRKAEDFQNHKLFKQILKHICATLCLYKPFGWGLIVNVFVALICIFQVVFYIERRICPNFHCGSRDFYDNGSRGQFEKTANTLNALLSISGLFSYNLLLISLSIMHRRKRQGKQKAISPSDALFNDLSNTQVKYIFLSQIAVIVFFLSSVAYYYLVIGTQPMLGWHSYWIFFGGTSLLVAQWAAVIGCQAFAIPCLALGTLANDTVRRIKEIGKKKKKRREDYGTTSENTSISNAKKVEEKGDPESGLSAKNVVCCINDLDIAFEYHEELCAIVSGTVSAYCPWFVMHFLCYGSTFLIEIIFISELELRFFRNPLQLVFTTVSLVGVLYLFMFPCICATYITDTCGGIAARFNGTTFKDWHEDHPFRDRAKLIMFTTYAKDRQCVFKVGRITFTPTLAWISLLLGSTAILFHFFS
ncbi:uncharacterized protein LOC114524207 [Dendronephthya gigantea]|uniref:uncharacterized protein LOC114524207 n=1 Tax=Dendronephthya gigantea TaxID=151771 RepID=UPI00106B98EF|nr:uncharacterized protein LOC114524207 [Dendronephthya gigantea]